jgi:hypothetical protein
MLHHIGEFRIGERIPRYEYGFIVETRFMRQDGGGQAADVVRNRDCQPVLPAAECMDTAFLAVTMNIGFSREFRAV